MKKALFILLFIIILPIVVLLSFIGWATLTDYSPAPIEVLETNQNTTPIAAQDTLDLMIWNIGYAGLGDEMDFFFDDGKQVRSSIEHLQRNLTFISHYLAQQQKLDFILLQEIDKKSHRSFYTNQFDTICQVLPNMNAHFGINYKVSYVPKPFSEPYGKILSGLATFSPHKATSTARHSLISEDTWPDRLFLLDRCFLAQRYPLTNGKELILVNTHNSAYAGTKIAQQQNAQIEEFATNEEKKGNYIIVAGDWNQLPPNYKPEFSNTLPPNFNPKPIPTDYLKSWQFVYDPKVPSNRDLNFPYISKQTHRQVIDFFLLSPNIKNLDVRGVDQDFKYADHQPVFLKVLLK